MIRKHIPSNSGPNNAGVFYGHSAISLPAILNYLRCWDFYRPCQALRDFSAPSISLDDDFCQFVIGLSSRGLLWTNDDCVPFQKVQEPTGSVSLQTL